MDNRAIKDAEHTAVYGPLKWEIKGYDTLASV